MFSLVIKNTIIVIFTVIAFNAESQRIIEADLNDIVSAAVSESPSKLLAETRLSNGYWQYVGFNSNFKPQLSFNAVFPNINRRIDAIPLPDGSEAFVNRSFMNTSAGVRLSQLVPKTGGRLFVSTELSRLDLFDTESQNYSKAFLSTPISIGFSQPIFQFNAFKWTRQINDLEFNQSKQRYAEETEEIIYDAVNLYFDLYISKINLEQAIRNKSYLDSLSVTSEGRFEVGRISETEMLQVQLGAKNANAQVNLLELEVQNKNESLRNYLGIDEEIVFNLDIPVNIPDYSIDFETALREAEKNRSQTTEFRLRLLQAEMDLDEVNKANGINLSLNGSFGLTKSGASYGDAYRDLLDQESITLSLNVPLADWGRSQAQREIARSNLELERLQIDQDRITFEREIAVNVEQFSLKRKQLDLAIESLEIAEKRLNISKNRYNIGKIDVTNLNIAIQEHESARQAYYSALWALRRAHHEIRLLTLYDFVEKRTILVGE
jgi:outer membrane protein TolC